MRGISLQAFSRYDMVWPRPLRLHALPIHIDASPAPHLYTDVIITYIIIFIKTVNLH